MTVQQQQEPIEVCNVGSSNNRCPVAQDMNQAGVFADNEQTAPTQHKEINGLTADNMQ